MQPKAILLNKNVLLLKVALLCSLLLLASCQSRQIGIGSSRGHKPKKEILAYKIDYKTGLEMARQICDSTFDQSAITKDGTGIRVYHEGNWFTEGTAGAVIYPRLIQNAEDNTETGIIFKVKAFGEGHNYSFVPGFMTKKFFKELRKVAERKKLDTVSFKKYKILEVTSIPDKISASIPTTLEGYKSFLKKKQYLYPFEGIWSSDDGAYVLGILYCRDEPQFKYKGFIISADKGDWKAGEIKVQWLSLENNELCMGDWYAQNKLKATMVFKVSDRLIMSVNAPREYGTEVVLLKTYPTSSSYDVKGGGTGFAISENGLIVTAYHLIKGAKTIKVYLSKDSFVSAKLLHGDPTNDLAVLKIEKFTPSFLQVAPMRSVKTGDRVFTIGFPISSILGKEAKYTEGVVSSLTGLKDASTFLQITVPVQPGNSGGALVNERGQVVGIVTSTAAILPFIKEGGTLPQNVNWAVKADYLRPLIDLPEMEQQELNRDQLIAHVKKATFLIETE